MRSDQKAIAQAEAGGNVPSHLVPPSSLKRIVDLEAPELISGMAGREDHVSKTLTLLDIARKDVEHDGLDESVVQIGDDNFGDFFSANFESEMRIQVGKVEFRSSF